MSNRERSNSTAQKGKGKAIMPLQGIRAGHERSNSSSHEQCLGRPFHEHQSSLHSRMAIDQPDPLVNLMQDPSMGHVHVEPEGELQVVGDIKGVPSTVELTLQTDNSKKVFLQRWGTQGYHPNLLAARYITLVIINMMPGFYPTWRKIPEKIRRNIFKQWKRCVRWAPHDEDFMWKAFNKKASSRLSSMYADCRKKMKPAWWMGESFWRAMQQHWEANEYKRMPKSNKRSRASDVWGPVHIGGYVAVETDRVQMDGESGREPTLNEVLRRIRCSKRTGVSTDRRAEGFTATGGHSSPSSQQSMNEAWKEAASGKKKDLVYESDASSEKGTRDDTGLTAAQKSQILELTRSIARLYEELQGVAKKHQLDEILQQMRVLNEMQVAMSQELRQISLLWQGMMQGYAQLQPQQPQPQPQPLYLQQQPWGMPPAYAHPQPPQPYVQFLMDDQQQSSMYHSQAADSSNESGNHVVESDDKIRP